MKHKSHNFISHEFIFISKVQFFIIWDLECCVERSDEIIVYFFFSLFHPVVHYLPLNWSLNQLLNTITDAKRRSFISEWMSVSWVVSPFSISNASSPSIDRLLSFIWFVSPIVIKWTPFFSHSLSSSLEWKGWFSIWTVCSFQRSQPNTPSNDQHHSN